MVCLTLIQSSSLVTAHPDDIQQTNQSDFNNKLTLFYRDYCIYLHKHPPRSRLLEPSGRAGSSKWPYRIEHKQMSLRRVYTETGIAGMAHASPAIHSWGK